MVLNYSVVGLMASCKKCGPESDLRDAQAKTVMYIFTCVDNLSLKKEK